MKCVLLAALVAGGLSSSGLHAQFETSNGFDSSSYPAVPAGAFIGGLDTLPNGNLAIFDGTSIVELNSSTGALVNTLFTPPGSVFGSFVQVDPTGTYLLFGESSNQKIWKVPLDGSTATEVAAIDFNFSCRFRSADLAYVTAPDATFSNTDILLLDVGTGATDLIARVPGPSGPMAVGAGGALYYGENSPSFPSPPGSSSIYFWTDAQIQTAIGIGALDDLDATPFRTGLDNVFDILFDPQGDLLASDSINGRLEEFNVSGLPDRLLGGEQPFNSVTFLALIDAGGPGQGIFAPFQPESGGLLAAVSTDWFSFNDLNLVHPDRVGFTASPAEPIPVGPFSLDLQGGPASGSLLICSAQGTVGDYSAWLNGVPFIFGLAPASFTIHGLVFLDGSGAVSIGGYNPGAAGTASIQALMWGGFGAPLGTTELLEIDLQ